MESQVEYSAEKVKEMLKCLLTEEEVRDLGSQLARKYSEITDLEEQKKAVTSEFKSRIDAASAEASSMARKIQNGYEFREVECEIQRIPDEKVIQWVRLDTGEVYKSRAMTQNELQESLFNEPE